jgi:hypothetical protein
MGRKTSSSSFISFDGVQIKRVWGHPPDISHEHGGSVKTTIAKTILQLHENERDQSERRKSK